MKLSEFTTLVQDGEVRDAQILEGDQQVRVTSTTDPSTSSPTSRSTRTNSRRCSTRPASRRRSGLRSPTRSSASSTTCSRSICSPGCSSWMMNPRPGRRSGRVMQFGRERPQDGREGSAQDFVRRRRRRRGGGRGAPGGQGVPGEPGRVPVDGRPDPARRPVVQPRERGRRAARARRRGRGRCRSSRSPGRTSSRCSSGSGRRIRDLFEQAKASSPASCSWTRSTPSAGIAAPGSVGVTTKPEQTLNQLLVEMDEFDGPR